MIINERNILVYVYIYLIKQKHGEWASLGLTCISSYDQQKLSTSLDFLIILLNEDPTLVELIDQKVELSRLPTALHNYQKSIHNKNIYKCLHAGLRFRVVQLYQMMKIQMLITVLFIVESKLIASNFCYLKKLFK